MTTEIQARAPASLFRRSSLQPALVSVLSWLYLIVIYAFIFLPVAVLVLFSFQDGRLPVPPFNGFSLQWYETVFADRKLMAALTNSFLVAILSSILACLLGFLAAYALARYRLPGSALQRGLLIAPMTVSYLIIALGMLAMLNTLRIPLSLWTVGIGHVVINLPLCFAIIYASMGDHHINIERAARDLGANDFKVMALVTAPMLMPSILAAFFLSVTFSWDEFIIAFLLSRFDVTLPVEIWSMLRSGLNPKTNAVGSLVFLVSVAVLLVLELALFGRSRKP
ncbi:ABC transporter permease [Rhizobiaceae bacterium n13]|uniref:ABC transporter permease n=1 Tax=Ferirhizobium litorale TaxID=2927786 RepID=A0AAE3QHY6_9HYPH|nr:ABC transporter permease [Fererhizobium litorale]MDI7862677.1 ABC transporter permease [Fererhizobium litorale]MDI7923840.1 ABC transporter permease [Fererhizobium litorale]